MKLLVLLSVCSCLALNTWAEPTPCAAPPLLVGNVAITGKEGTFLSVAEYSYDAVREQVRIRDFGLYDNKGYSVDFLMQFQQGVMYEIDSTRSTCKKFALKSSFHPMRIPASAKMESEVVLGTTSFPDSCLPITSWKGEDKDIGVSYVLTVTKNLCLPVSAVIQTKEFGSITMGFYNQLLTLHPADFNPPSYCEGLPEENLPKTDFFSALHSAA
ncbi:ependymin-like [Astyanax mexicanus]|uniref:Ependymin-like n=1 Tax=Astyanax mexicanus TaxID=7994 RepID=A0A8T2LZ86_ASTMX|nr:ependymin-like [Astyanax mexicanus]